jgi:hypothetical protein
MLNGREDILMIPLDYHRHVREVYEERTRAATRTRPEWEPIRRLVAPRRQWIPRPRTSRLPVPRSYSRGINLLLAAITGWVLRTYSASRNTLRA